MIDSDLKFKVIEKQWFIVDRTTGEIHSGPHTTSAAAIAARQKLAQVDVNATAEQVSRKSASRQEARERGGWTV